MKIKITISNILILLCLLTSCNSKTNNNNNESSTNSYSTDQENIEDEPDYILNESEDGEDSEETYSGCKFEDGNYSATVHYNNPETGYSATYNLDVEVQDCQVVQINFPSSGYLDEDHISYADIDEDGRASVDGEDGKTYEIQIYN
jgi:major membrane immunogen (membrane-anchored lipoprotein)